MLVLEEQAGACQAASPLTHRVGHLPALPLGDATVLRHPPLHPADYGKGCNARSETEPV